MPDSLDPDQASADEGAPDSTTAEVLPSVDAEEQAGLEKTEPPEGDKARLKSVLVYSVLAGLCPLVPVPFLDDFLVSFLRRFMLRDLCKAHNFTASGPQLHALRHRPINRLLGCLTMVFVYPIKKVFRKIFYFLAIKEAIDLVSDVLHEGMLVNIALKQGLLVLNPEKPDDKEPFVRLRDSIVATLSSHQTRPVDQVIKRVLKRNKSLVKEVAVSVGTDAVDVTDSDAVEGTIDRLATGEFEPVGKLVTKMTKAIDARPDYLSELENALVEQLRVWDEAKASDDT